ncbi:MAG: hypothetical protein RI580_05925 [Halothece sp. Uz-M2-17]|nr:hypothetical protein [Halothece sp. Uz-M2-17]
MSSSSSYQVSLWKQVKIKAFPIILTAIFLIWTPFLIGTTLKIQHSCNPMISFGDKALPEKCREEETQAEGRSILGKIRSIFN